MAASPEPLSYLSPIFFAFPALLAIPRTFLSRAFFYPALLAFHNVFASLRHWFFAFALR